MMRWRFRGRRDRRRDWDWREDARASGRWLGRGPNQQRQGATIQRMGAVRKVAGGYEWSLVIRVVHAGGGTRHRPPGGRGAGTAGGRDRAAG